jgi:ABC-type lipoprotein export system ATPase subunit/cell division protein FtsX
MKDYDMKKIDLFRNEHIGYVFQSYNLLLNETVYDNLRIALEMIDIYDEKEVNSRIEYALKSVGMYKYRKKRASQLSGGQQQRVVIARALIKRCKIIIADEPTGNLDSTNAMEVMNILKSISKKTLVLLVTHNQKLANFYSDYIYKLLDGQIVEHYQNNNDNSLDTSDQNVVYLKDLTLEESSSNKVNIKLYTTNESNQKIELEIVERNNTFYIQSNQNIKLIENNNIKLLNEHYKKVDKKDFNNDLDNIYDDSFFNDNIKKKNILSDLIINFKRAFNLFIKPTKKVMLIYISFIFLGIFFGICAITMANANYINESQINADKNYYQLVSENRYNSDLEMNYIKEALYNGDIKSINKANYAYLYIYKQINFVENYHFDYDTKVMYFDENIKLLYGKAPLIGEIAISKGFAKEILKDFNGYYKNINELIGVALNLNTSSNEGALKVSGIVDNDYKMNYLNKKDYINLLIGDYYPSKTYFRSYDVEKKYNSYEVILGRDLTEEDRNTRNILISDNFEDYENIIGTETEYGNVVGVFKLKDIEFEHYEFILNYKHDEFRDFGYLYTYDYSNYKLVEGREPLKESECLASIYSGFKVGEVVDHCTVVGLYNSNSRYLTSGILSSLSSLVLNKGINSCSFLVEDMNNLKEILNDEYNIKSMYQYEYDVLKKENQEIMKIFLTLGSIYLIVGIILVYFLMRSKMVMDIYNIGVYRSIGSSKNRIYLRYFAEIVVLVTFTATIAYLLCLFVYYTGINAINDSINKEIFSNNPIFAILGLIVLYGVNIVFGLLPIYRLLRKTPAEILAKYDI